MRTLIMILMSVVLLSWLLIAIGCSNTNPAASVGQKPQLGNPLGDGGVDDGIVGDGGKKDRDISGGYEDDLLKPPDIKGGKYSDTLYRDHLIMGHSLATSIGYDIEQITGFGGSIRAEVGDTYYQLTVPPFNFSCLDTISVVMTVLQGSNEYGEELTFLYLGPRERQFVDYPILEFRDEVDPGRNPRVRYDLYCWAAGTWVSYGYTYADQNGIVRFFIPRFSNYAILKGDHFKPGDFGA